MKQALLSSLARIPPLWELESFVAVNPFLGWTGRSFESAMRSLEELWGRPVVARTDGGAHASARSSWRKDTADAILGPFLASYYDKDTAIWPAPWKDLRLFEAWKASLPGSAGLARKTARRLTAALAALPPTPIGICGLIAERHRMDEQAAAARVLQLLAELPGWASYMRRRAWPSAPGDDSDLAALAAMLWILDEVIGIRTVPEASPAEELTLRLRAQEAREKSFIEPLLAALSRASAAAGALPARPAASSPSVRAAFCIDVRSEVFRRAWESLDQGVQTDGFAGFFGLPLSWDQGSGSEDLFPVLLHAGVRLKGSRESPPRAPVKRLAAGGPQGLAFVEVGGVLSSLSLARGVRTAKRVDRYPGLEDAVRALPRELKTRYADGILKNLGWGGPWAPLMLFIGHRGSCVNNPHAAGQDCGACGGRSGEASARMAAALCNDQEVRAELRSSGRPIPDAVLFLGGLHDTTLDHVTLFSRGAPRGWAPLIDAAREQLEEAGALARAERARAFPFLDREAAARASDWAETRPETALAGNAAFVAAPRSLTRGLDLGGRVFLHSYEPGKDPDGSVLELILTAPVIVASWISLQYMASAASPELYGAGDKVLHTVVGGLGVAEGNNRDIRAGLPLQSVSFEGKLYHDPLRLHVVIGAPEPAIDQVLRRHQAVRELVENQWVHLFALGSDGACRQRTADGWRAAEREASPVAPPFTHLRA
jgi:uncharacterized protein YbcC (UPF0753/DUF2309 family)